MINKTIGFRGLAHFLLTFSWWTWLCYNNSVWYANNYIYIYLDGVCSWLSILYGLVTENVGLIFPMIASHLKTGSWSAKPLGLGFKYPWSRSILHGYKLILTVVFWYQWEYLRSPAKNLFFCSSMLMVKYPIWVGNWKCWVNLPNDS